MIADIQIIFEDDQILVINKPAGMVVNRAESVKGWTMQDWLEERETPPNLPFRKGEGSPLFVKEGVRGSSTNNWDEVNRALFHQRSGIVHRLDKETSGVLVIAKTPDAYVELLRQFRERTVEKTYWTLVHGEVKLKAKSEKLKIDRDKELGIKGENSEFSLLTSLKAGIQNSEDTKEILKQVQDDDPLKKLETRNLKLETMDDWQVIDEPVGRLPWNRKRFGVLPGGRKAVTEYRVLRVIPSDPDNHRGNRGISLRKEGAVDSLRNSSSSARQKSGLFTPRNDSYSLLELRPKTGRTHQIRVHMKQIGHPVVGDELYAGRKTARADRRWCPRLWLHARSLEIIHPSTKEKMKFEAEFDGELQKALNLL